MAAVSCNIEVDRGAVMDFTRSMIRFETELGNSVQTSTKRAALNLLRALGEKTPKSPQRVDAGAIRKATVADVMANSRIPREKVRLHHPLNGQDFREFVVQRYGRQVIGYHAGRGKVRMKSTPRLFVGRSGAYVKNAAGAGYIRNSGLAKRSWGWLSALIFNHGDVTKMKGDFRKKRSEKFYSGYLKSWVTGGFKGTEVMIHNWLDYIGVIVTPAVVNAAFDRAVNLIEHAISASQAKAARDMSSAA